MYMFARRISDKVQANAGTPKIGLWRARWFKKERKTDQK